MYQQYLKVPSILHSPQFLVLLIIFTLAILVHLKGYLIVTLMCSFSKDPWFFIIFHVLVGHLCVCVCILWRLCSSISHFLMVCLSSYWDIVYIFWIPVFCKMYILQVVFYDTLLLSWSLIFSSFTSFLRWKFRSLISDCWLFDSCKYYSHVLSFFPVRMELLDCMITVCIFLMSTCMAI